MCGPKYIYFENNILKNEQKSIIEDLLNKNKCVFIEKPGSSSKYIHELKVVPI